MSNVLLVEPEYRSKFPPLGLLRIARWHREQGDAVTFIRGRNDAIRSQRWHRVYVSSLFTWELPRTVATARFYARSVSDSSNLVVGGIGATLLPDYIKERVDCRVVTGPLDRPGKIAPEVPALHSAVPDYSVLDASNYPYSPDDSYFCRTSVGCCRKCVFCAVPHLEPRFNKIRDWRSQIRQARDEFGERQHLVILDNNPLGLPNPEVLFRQIRAEGFEPGTRLNNKQRHVDFNQGLDARFVTPATAKALAQLPVWPIRLALDHDSMAKAYEAGIKNLAAVGFHKFTNYMMYNFNDTPESLYSRMCFNFELMRKYGVAITGFPMRYVPPSGVTRHYVAPGWPWRYLRGVQCVLSAVRGLVSPSRTFFNRAFGSDLAEFKEILAMPDRYIMYRDKYENSAAWRDWQRRYRRLSEGSKAEFLDLLATLNRSKSKTVEGDSQRKFGKLLGHYYPGGKVIRE